LSGLQKRWCTPVLRLIWSSDAPPSTQKLALISFVQGLQSGLTFPSAMHISAAHRFDYDDDVDKRTEWPLDLLRPGPQFDLEEAPPKANQSHRLTILNKCLHGFNKLHPQPPIPALLNMPCALTFPPESYLSLLSSDVPFSLPPLITPVALRFLHHSFPSLEAILTGTRPLSPPIFSLTPPPPSVSRGLCQMRRLSSPTFWPQ